MEGEPRTIRLNGTVKGMDIVQMIDRVLKQVDPVEQPLLVYRLRALKRRIIGRYVNETKAA